MPLSDNTLFVQGPYANAVLRFQIDFPGDYPHHPPVVTFLSDVFHPLITPLNTYTYTVRDATAADTVSAADRDRLPPGGLSLRHGFPEWFAGASESIAANNADANQPAAISDRRAPDPRTPSAALTIEVLQYLRVIFDTETILDAVSLEDAANPGAWHAWRSFRSGPTVSRAIPAVSFPHPSSVRMARERSSSPRQLSGSARRPAEWNWQGVWEDRVRKSIQASLSEHMLYANEHDDAICFSKMDEQIMSEMVAESKTLAV